MKRHTIGENHTAELKVKMKNAYSLTAHNILVQLNECRGKNIALTSSVRNEQLTQLVTANIATELNNQGKSCLVLSSDGQKNIQSTYTANGLTADGVEVKIPTGQLKDYMDKMGAEYDVIICHIIPPQYFVGGFEHLKWADAVFLLEHCGQTKYSEFEQMLELLRLNKIALNGVITYN